LRGNGPHDPRGASLSTANRFPGGMALAQIVPVEMAVPGGVRVVEYTDPYSVWCWGCEPLIRRLAYRYPDVEVVTVMGGLFEDFTPMKEYWIRMSGGRWQETVEAFLTAVAGQHGMPTNVPGMMTWMEDFRSTWPACIAVKAAERQGVEAGRKYLRRIREAVQVEGRDIGARETQIALAKEADLDSSSFAGALDDGSTRLAFKDGLTQCQLRGVSGFPSFDIQRGELSVRVEGFRTWEAFDQLLHELHPDVRPRPLEPSAGSVVDVLRSSGRCATREVAGVLGITDDDAEILLEELEVAGRAKREVHGVAVLWRVS